MQVLRCTELPIVQGQRLFQRTNRLPAGHRFATTVRPASEAVLADHTKEEYQFLPRGRLPTYYFQKSLPRLPIPKLELTCQRYVEALTPLVSEDQLGKTENLAKNFEQGIGKQLHDELVKKDKELKETSYISGPWFEAYLKDRQPLPININPALVFVEDDSLDNLNASQRQLVRTTNLVVSSLRFMKSLDNETLSPEVFHLSPSKSDTPTYYRVMKFLPTAFATYGSYLFKAFPLDMSQYTSLFRSTRIPQKNIDRLKKSSRNVRHIVAIRRGNFYSVPVLDDKGNILPVDELKGSLESILNDESPAASHPVGVMTSQERNTWAEIREHMCQNDRNKQTLEEIDSALYVLGLDDEELGEDPNDVTRAFLHSDGSNRWFDKSFTLISSKDGWAGLNFEHAWGDGVAVMRFFNEVHKDSTSNLWSNSIKSKKPFITPVKLAFELDGKSKQAIEDAQKRLNEHAGRLQIHPFIFEKYGRRECKAWGVGPDCIMQLGFQVVHHRLFGCTDTTYESCSTSAFRHGRTEAIRPATTLTKQVGEIMSRPDWKNQKKELQELIRKCSDKHNELTKNAAMGQGFDRHLFAMRILAEQGSGKLPDIYNDESYAKINHNVLSTSTLSSPAVRIGAFGPVVADGYGLAYQIWEGGLGSLITTYKGGKDGEAFANTCHQVFGDFGEIFQ